MNIVEYLAAKESDFPSGVGGNQNRAKRRVNVGLTSKRPETGFEMTGNADPKWGMQQLM